MVLVAILAVAAAGGGGGGIVGGVVALTALGPSSWVHRLTNAWKSSSIAAAASH